MKKCIVSHNSCCLPFTLNISGGTLKFDWRLGSVEPIVPPRDAPKNSLVRYSRSSPTDCDKDYETEKNNFIMFMNTIFSQLLQDYAQHDTLLFELPLWGFKTDFGPGIYMREIISFFFGLDNVLGQRKTQVTWAQSTYNTSWFVANSEHNMVFDISVSQSDLEEVKNKFPDSKLDKLVLKNGSVIHSNTPVKNCLGQTEIYFDPTLPLIFEAGPTFHEDPPMTKYFNDDTTQYSMELLNKRYRLDIAKRLDEHVKANFFAPVYSDVGTGGFYSLKSKFKEYPEEYYAQITCEKKVFVKAYITLLMFNVFFYENLGFTLRNEIGFLLGYFGRLVNAKKYFVLYLPQESHCTDVVSMMLCFLGDKITYVNGDSFELISNNSPQKNIYVVIEYNFIVPTLGWLCKFY